MVVISIVDVAGRADQRIAGEGVVKFARLALARRRLKVGALRTALLKRAVEDVGENGALIDRRLRRRCPPEQPRDHAAPTA